MAVEAVQKNNSNNSNKMNYAGSLAIGAISGYAAKWAIPITHPEKDERYNDELSQVRRNVMQARTDEIKAIRTEIPQTLGADEFVRMYDEKKHIYTEIKKLENTSQENMMSLLRRINSKAIEANNIGKEKMISYTKSIRSSAAFLSIGMIVALGIAVVYNVAKEVAKNAEGDN